MSSRPERPFVFVNMAMTADGKIATANRRVSSFSSPQDREQLLRLRARADAVMAGARTVDLNPVNLGPGGPRFRKMRLKQGLAEYNTRVIVTGSGSIDLKAAIFQRRFSPILILTTAAIGVKRLAQLRKAADDVWVSKTRTINFKEALEWLHSKWNVRRLLCEGGGELNSALFSAGLVDELNLTICPKIFGGRTAPTICDGTGAETLGEATRLKLRSSKRVGDELFLVYDVLPRR